VRPFLLVLVAACTLAASGCGGDEPPPPPRSALAERLAELCVTAREDVEALGRPFDEGAAVFKPWSRVGLRFVGQARKLPVTNARQRRNVSAMADFYEGFYDSLALGYLQSAAGQSPMTKQTLRRGYAQLASAERIARQLGAPECAVRPFEAES
jgi:hypothetical protein